MVNTRFFAIMLIVFSSAFSVFAENSTVIDEVVIEGNRIRVGQDAGSVRRLLGDIQYKTSDTGDHSVSKGYYNSNGKQYIFTFGTSTSPGPSYVVKQIEAIGVQAEDSSGVSGVVVSGVKNGNFPREKMSWAQRNFKVYMLSVELKDEKAVAYSGTDRVRLRIINDSTITIPELTVLTKRYDEEGNVIGTSRSPKILVDDLEPGASKEMDYYPDGYRPGTKKITVEIDYLGLPSNVKE